MFRRSVINALVDTLMALWNSTWREKIVSSFFAILVVGVSLFLFFVQIGVPGPSRQSSATSHSSAQKRSAKSGSLVVNPPVTTRVQTIAPTSVLAVATNTPPTPTPMPTESSDVVDSPAPASAPMPVEMPGIVSAPGFDTSSNVGIANPASRDTSSAPKRSVTPAKHHTHPTRATATPAPSVTTSPVSGISTPAPTPPPSPTNTVVGATPTVVIPVDVPTPAPSATSAPSVPAYPTSAIPTSDSAKTATVAPDILPTKVGGAQIATPISPAPTASR